MANNFLVEAEPVRYTGNLALFKDWMTTSSWKGTACSCSSTEMLEEETKEELDSSEISSVLSVLSNFFWLLIIERTYRH